MDYHRHALEFTSIEEATDPNFKPSYSFCKECGFVPTQFVAPNRVLETVPEPKLNDFYAAWLVKHNAPEDHPHRELFDKLVETITALEQFAKAPMQAYTPEPEEFTR